MSRPMECTVYSRGLESEELCSLGEKHQVMVVLAKRVSLVGTYLYDNGYEKLECGIYEDRQGNTYHEMITIDYAGNVKYARRSRSGKHTSLWYPTASQAARGAVAVDVLGRKL